MARDITNAPLVCGDGRHLIDFLYALPAISLCNERPVAPRSIELCIQCWSRFWSRVEKFTEFIFEVKLSLLLLLLFLSMTMVVCDDSAPLPISRYGLRPLRMRVWIKKNVPLFIYTYFIINFSRAYCDVTGTNNCLIKLAIVKNSVDS